MQNIQTCYVGKAGCAPIAARIEVSKVSVKIDVLKRTRNAVHGQHTYDWYIFYLGQLFWNGPAEIHQS